MSTESLRVTHLIRAKPPGEIGGADAHLLDLATAQAADGHRVRVIFLGPAHISAAVRDRHIPVIHVHSMSMAAWVRAVHAELRANPPDVLHSHGYRADLVAVVLRAFRPAWAKWILAVTVHGFIRTSVGLRALSRLNEHVLRCADVVIAVSSPETQRLTKMLRRAVHFIPNEVPRAELVSRQEACRRLGIDPARPVVAFVGRLSAEKRPDLFVTMAALVARNRPTAEFIVIGTGELLNDTVRRAEATPHVSILFPGMVPDAATIMTCFDVLVCPSDMEGTPRVVIEAMSAGVPVVATRVGGLIDLIADGQTGILVPSNSAAALAEGVIRLLGNPSLSGEISKHARASMAGAAVVAKMANRVIAAYRSGISNTSRSPVVGAASGLGDVKGFVA